MGGVDGHVAALGLVLLHQRLQHARLFARRLDRLEHAVQLHAAIERGGRAGALGVGEVAGDAGHDLLRRQHHRAAERLVLLAHRRGVKTERAVHEHAVQRAQKWRAVGRGRGQVHHRRRAQKGQRLGGVHAEEALSTHASWVSCSWYLRKHQFRDID
jgi:hypothetical protein